MTTAPKMMWLEANLAGTSTTPSVSTISSFITAKGIKRIYVDMTATLNAGLIPFYDHIWLAQLRAAVVPLGCELWAASAGSTVDHDAAAYACATAGLRARMAADLTVTNNPSYNPGIPQGPSNWPYIGTAKTTALFHGFSADLEPWVNVPWPGGGLSPTNAQQDNYVSICSNTAGELRVTTAGYKLYYNGAYTATNAPVMKFLLHTSFWADDIGWHGGSPATDNVAKHILAWVDECDIMTHNSGSVQETYSTDMLAVAQALSNITKTYVTWEAVDFITSAALVADMDARYTTWKLSYSKMSGTNCYYYAGTASAYDWASK